uniref:alkaline phosphatase n=1 Tax=Octopus bimaculoides TaxID=37653 RepID=A0A0L8GVT5_OCTBM
MKGIWKNLCPNLIDNFEEFDNHEGLQKETDTIINIAKELNFEISPEDVKEALYADGNEITYGELLKMEKFKRGRIDHGHHVNSAIKALSELSSFDDAVAKGVDITNEKDTLIIVSADHSHVFNIAGYPERGTNILGW